MSVPTCPSNRGRNAGQTTAEWLVIAGVVVAILLAVATIFRVQIATAFTTIGTRIMCGVSGGANCTPAGTQAGGAAAGAGAGTAAGTNPTTGLVTTTGGAGSGAAGAGGRGGLPPGTPPIRTGLGGPLDTLINTSPEFNQLVSQMQQQGYTFVTGAPGGGSFCDPTTKVITIDANDTTGKDLGDLTGVIAHELGHANYTMDPYVKFDGLTRDQYVQANLDRHLKDEGEATIKSFEMRDSVAANGGQPPITIRGARSADYERIYNQYLMDGDREKARTEIGRLVGQFETTSNTDPPQTYNDYYGQDYIDYYNRTHPGGMP